jgi:hypothetical protein
MRILLLSLILLLASCSKNNIIQSNIEIAPNIKSLAKITPLEGRIIYQLGEYRGFYKYSKHPKTQVEKYFAKENKGWINIIDNSSELNAVWFGADPLDNKDDSKAV